MSVIDDIPPAALSAVVALVRAIVSVVQAGEDDAAREEALMQAAEDIKRELDRAKFGTP